MCTCAATLRAEWLRRPLLTPRLGREAGCPCELRPLSQGAGIPVAETKETCIVWGNSAGLGSISIFCARRYRCTANERPCSSSCVSDTL